MSKSKPIVYIRGLNSYGTDLMTLGPVPLVTMPMHLPWVRFFRSQGHSCFHVEGLGGGRLEEQLALAHQFLMTKQEQLKDGFHLVGHSAGGLIGWGLGSMPEWSDKILSLTTLATPHRGSHIARRFLEMSKQNTLKMKLIRYCGYDDQCRIPVFNDFTDEGVAAFKSRRPFPSHIPLRSYSFSLKPEEMGWPIRWSLALGFDIENREHDGMIELDSQIVGEHAGHFALDHSSQIGYHFYLNPRERALRAKLYRDLTFDLCRHLETL